MLSWIFESLYQLVCDLLLEFVFFILVDVVAKAPLREATSDAEKRIIWLYEAGVLLGISAIIYWADHTPYLLVCLAVATALYTQLNGRVDIWQWYVSLCTRWEEYQQHEESMRQVQAHIARQQAVAASVPQSGSMGNLPGLYPVLTSPHSAGMPNTMSPQGYPPNVTLLPGRDIPGGPSANAAGPVFRSSRGGLIWPAMSQATASPSPYFAQHQTSNSNTTSFGPPNAGGYLAVLTQSQNTSPVDKSAGDSLPSKGYGGDLKRRPLRQIDSRMMSPSLGGGASAIKNKFMNALGFSGQMRKPPGLKNKGQNQCFMNSVLQCVARSPYLAQCLTVDAAKELEVTVSESIFLSALSELLDFLTAEPETLDCNVLDPSCFRQAASALKPNLVAPVGHPQEQQDAAEFLMWMLHSVHKILNQNRQALSCGADSENTYERFSSPRLTTLRFVYGDLTPAKARELKDICMREIELANGLENDSYAESIQRLSDLEWLLHKQCNESIVDGLFTGQLLEANLSSGNNRISVSLQTFNVLPVPLAAPRPVSGLVLLEDCFTAFCHIEHLVDSVSGAAAWNVNNSAPPNRGGDGASTPLLPARTRSGTRLNTADSAVQSPLSRMSSVVSPIAGHPNMVNDSGFSDSVFKTSTPILDGSEKVAGGAANNEVHRRCLLRQLPECLIIQLMRFQYDVRKQRCTKLRAPVSVRLKGLDLQALVYDTVTQQEDLAAPAGGRAAHTYDLYGLCLHFGADSTHHGHYISYSLAADNRWYRFDDELVTEVNMEYELTTKEVRQNVYILFYKRAGS